MKSPEFSPEFKICIGNNIIFKRNAEILAEKKRKEAEKEQQQRNKEKQLAAKVEDRRKSSQNFQISFFHMTDIIERCLLAVQMYDFAILMKILKKFVKSFE